LLVSGECTSPTYNPLREVGANLLGIEATDGESATAAKLAEAGLPRLSAAQTKAALP